MPNSKNQSGIIPLVILAIVGVISASGVTVVASQKSIPGDALYPVKKAVENVRVATAISEKDKAKVHLAVAEEKVKEIKKLQEVGRVEKIAETVQNLKDSEVKASQLTQVAKSKGQNTAELTSLLQTQISKQQIVLKQVSTQIPKQARQAIQKTLDQLRKDLKSTAEATKEGSSSSPTPTPSARSDSNPTPTPCPSPSPSPGDVSNQEDEDTGNQENENGGHKYKDNENVNVLGILFSFANRGFSQLQNSQYNRSNNPCDSYEENSEGASEQFDGTEGQGSQSPNGPSGDESPNGTPQPLPQGE